MDLDWPQSDGLQVVPISEGVVYVGDGLIAHRVLGLPNQPVLVLQDRKTYLDKYTMLQ